MKKLSLLGLIIFMSFNMVFACDLCSIYMNLEPNDLKNSFGMNYRKRTFKSTFEIFENSTTNTKHGSGDTDVLNATSQVELYNTVDLWVNHFIGSRVQLFATVSLSDNSYSENDSLLYNISGLGDISIVSKYLLYNTMATDSSKFSVRLLLGGGIKIPTGSFNKSYTVTPFTDYKGNTVFQEPYSELDPHLQPGTGSLDFILTQEFQIRYNKLGFSTNNSYRINTRNKNDFRFANRLNSNNYFFYLLKMGDFTFTPIAGISLEYSKRDQFKDRAYLNSGGSVIFQNIGLKTYYKNLALGASFWAPLRQQLNDHQLQNKNRINFDLTYYF